MPNHLAQAQSLYLRKHADNPVDWWPWCDAALEAAQQDNKPIFLSIGYSSCHWCTVMEGEAFSDPEIAEYLNAYFMPIKVDREERPDIDSIYMQALQMMTGQGGWPLNIFLTPDDLIPFFGGTYFPVDPKYGRPGFLQILQTLRRFFDTEKAKVSTVKTEILENLQKSAELPAADDLSQAVLERGLASSAQILEPTGYGTCFPMIPYGTTALRGSRFTLVGEVPESLSVCTQRGLDLTLGGIFDHVAGGFHRYTVDPTWTVPHFEKMLYDNGQIMEYLADLWSLGVQEPAFQRAITHTVQWLTREMTAPEGYFYAAQDADSFMNPDAAEPEEGAFYIWHYSELQTRLGEESLASLAEHFTVTETGNFEGWNVLQRKQPGLLEGQIEADLATLFQARYGQSLNELEQFPPARNNQEAKTHRWPGRIPAVTDTKMIVAWNSLMISGLARAAAVLGRKDYFDIAARAAHFILQHQEVNGRLHRLNYEGTPTVLAQSEDYAFFIKALLDLHQAAWVWPLHANETPWLDHALRIQSEFDQWLWSEAAGGYYNTAKDVSNQLLVRERAYQDNATPAANGLAITNLVKLALLSEDLRYLDRAEQGLQAFGAVMVQMPRACPSLLAALDWFRHATLVRTLPEHLGTLIAQYAPTAVFKPSETLPSGTVGMVCEGLFCKEPAVSLTILQQQLQASQQR